VVSTGSGVALAYIVLSALRGIPTCYVESATRVDGPSFTGKTLAQVPGVQLFTQHERWAGGQWRYVGSVFEGFESIPRAAARPRPIRRLVVSLGTIRSYEFRRLVMRILEVVPADVEVVWQTGSTRVSDLPIQARSEIPYHELVREMTEADAVVAHAGTGIALSAFKAGICPLLVPRRVAFNEHVDDHQMQTAKILGDTGLAIVRQVEQLTLDDLRLAADRAVVQRTHASPFQVIRKLVPA
jgi:UDP-N-acetylglucosamine transferase subunit ALG13